jgi:hypothetical protein
MPKPAQERFVCTHCGTEGWWTPSTHIGPSPLQSHDRPDGRKCPAWLALPPATDALEIHEWVFTGTARGAIGMSPHSERVVFAALPGQASDRAWEALLAVGAYGRGEHYTPVIRARLGRFSDAQSGVYLRGLAAARTFVSEGMEPSQAVDMVARHFPEKLTALEIAAVAIALLTGSSCGS